jgi:hypothetical protein
LLKTFWVGVDGWAEQQLPDGTIIWTLPTGQKYTTQPGGRLYFPGWNTTTATLALPNTNPTRPTGIMMPKRKRTRTAEHAQRIQHERAINDAERSRPPPF